MLDSNTVDSWVQAPVRSNQRIWTDICCFSAKYVASRSKDRLDRNQNNVSAWRRHFYPRTVVFKWNSTIEIQWNVLIYFKADIFIISLNVGRKSLKIPKGQSESVYRRRTDNTMAKRKCTKDKQRSTKHTHKTKIE